MFGRKSARLAADRDPGASQELAPAGYFELTGDLWVSLVLVLPLLLAYQVGVWMIDMRALNGVDFLTRYVVSIHGSKGIVLLNLTIVAVFLAAIIRLGNDGRFRARLFAPLLVESAIYAWLLGSFVMVILRKLSLLSILNVGQRELTGLVLSVGAGVYEEIVFRLFAILVLTYVFKDLLEFKKTSAIVIAIIISSLLFSLAHHLGPFGEPFRARVFAFRALAGLLFAVIYKVRSFAVAVYTHAIYDLYVLVL
ncbi:MAG: CPBP family glutamic-type intramembrane protease [Planctomycetota bacterium]|jgi:hypothetical protein